MKKGFKYLALVLALFSGNIVANAMTMEMPSFSDVPSTHVNYKAIVDLRNRGIISGYPDETFRPEQLVNRVEALKILLGAAKINSTSSLKTAVFSDTDVSQWYAPYLNKAVELNIVAGYPDGTFKPTKIVNLVESLKMLLNAFAVDVSKISVVVDPYGDAPKDQWFAAYLQYAKENKLIDADDSGNIQPSQGMTRARLAEVAYRLLVLKESQAEKAKPVVTEPVIPDNNSPEGEYVLSVNIKDMAFNKSEMTIGLGSTVRWTNADSANHSVISDSGNELQSGVLSNGNTYIHKFDTLGTFAYHCGVHSEMKGIITVLPANQVPTI